MKGIELQTMNYRLGNWINPNFPMQIVGLFDNTIYTNFEGNEGDVWEYNTKDIPDIPIDEEWLIKLGFKKDQDNEDDEKNYWYILEISDFKNLEFQADQSSGFKTIFLILAGKKIEIKKVHEFQNIFKALTGNEPIIQ